MKLLAFTTYVILIYLPSMMFEPQGMVDKIFFFMYIFTCYYICMVVMWKMEVDDHEALYQVQIKKNKSVRTKSVGPILLSEWPMIGKNTK